jgi:3-hydroxyisobutyrate dehydrogenase-like beta-hydroxyacid dehydrogenase
MNPAPTTDLGFLGLGAMGGPMARHLLAAGHRVHVFDLSPERLAAVVRAGGIPASDARAVVQAAAVVFTSLPTNEIFLSVAAQTLLPHARTGQVFVDLGTTVPFETRRLAAAFAAVGATLLDVPVSGGSTGAEKGRLRMFVGGDEAAFHRLRPLLETMGGAEKITYCGPSGCGQIAKGVNQLKSALGTAAMVEALAFAVRAGVPAETIAAAFGAGSPGEASGIVKYAQAIAANPDAHFGVKFRELPYYLAEAQAGGFPLPLTAALHAFCDRGARVVTDDGLPAPSFWRELRDR